MAQSSMWKLPKPKNMVWLAAAIVAINGFFPALWVLFTSFKTESELMRIPITIWPAAPTFENYVRVFVDQPILTFLFNSFMVAVFSTLLCVTVSACAAYALVRLRIPAPNLILRSCSRSRCSRSSPSWFRSSRPCGPLTSSTPGRR
jgi:multiple sugar transport system permease protein